MIDDNSLPISEETLGAYLEGNLSDADASNIAQMIDSNDELKDFVNDLQNTEIDWSTTMEDDYDGSIPDVEIPEVETNGMEDDILLPLYAGVQLLDDTINDDHSFLSHDDTSIFDDSDISHLHDDVDNDDNDSYHHLEDGWDVNDDI